MSQYAQGDIIGHIFQANMQLPAVAAGTASTQYPVFCAERNVRVKKVSIIPQAAATGDNTNRKNVNAINKGGSGSGTTEIGNLDLVTGTNLVAFDESVVYTSSTGTTMSAGDVLNLEVEQVGTGLSFPICLVKVEYELQ